MFSAPHQVIRALPDSDPLILELRNEGRSDAPSAIAVFHLKTKTEARWDVVPAAVREQAPGFGQASWSTQKHNLLYATQKSLNLIGHEGEARHLCPYMPGHLTVLAGMSSYALSPNGVNLVYLLDTRDIGDRQPDGFGRLYSAPGGTAYFWRRA